MVAEASTGGSSEGKPNLLSTLPKELPLDFLKEITLGFSEDRILSKGAFGKFYKGILENGQEVAVKKLEGDVQVTAGKRFLNAATNLMALQHENILKLLSCCSEAKKKVVEHKGKYILVDTEECVLCYEYVPKGSLQNYLSDDANRTDWDTHFKIIKGICQGVYFLHEGEFGRIVPEGEFGRIVHLDLQPANVLLDENMVPKIADFGLSRFFNLEQSRLYTMNVVRLKGYMAPEYLYRGEISCRCDIYSLGVLIIEITTREKNCCNDKDMSARGFIASVRQTWTDEHIVSEYVSLDADRLQQVKACIDIALKCVDVDQKNRPSIVEVVDRLHGRCAS
ncbi:Cysteine-rich receptor-like protein kinase 36 [Dichanthelium oligosanthes]|uniref:Cysteine-rich receptor-like protein kinase 36 n=1 Tax=Dichanthelium oligosanthes TaxID=888268 RepID=A0A1E5W3M8_9POAL|nr:Cysteine-rich receptor-like protein kinase 36 [Dichanthelium oligosanthes]